MTQKELSRKVSRSQAAIANIEVGISEPSSELIAALAAHTKFPPGFFSTERVVEFPVESLMLRARAATTRREVVAACRYAEIIYELSEYLGGFVNTVPVSLIKSNQEPLVAAQTARRNMGIPADVPIPHVIHEIEKSGVLVLAVPLEIQRIDAFSAWVGNPARPVIAISKGKSGDRQRWNAAHELGHLLLHAEQRRLRKEHHREADQFAAAFLLPEESMRREITQPVTLATIGRLKPRWGVAIQALVRRAYELNLITKRQYTYLFEQITSKGWRVREPENLDIPIEKPRALMKMAEIAFGTPVSFSRIAIEIRLSPEIIQEVFSGYDTVTSVGQPHSSKIIPLPRRG